FMVTPTAPVRLHRIRNDQLYHYYLGDPLEVLLLHSDGTTERVVVGPNLRGGERLQLFIPGNTFHTARLMGRRRWFLGASTEWPGVVPADVETGNVDELAAKFPSTAADLRTIADSVGQDQVRLRATAASPSSPLRRHKAGGPRDRGDPAAASANGRAGRPAPHADPRRSAADVAIDRRAGVAGTGAESGALAFGGGVGEPDLQRPGLAGGDKR